MGFTDESVERYLMDIVPARDAVLSDIESVAAREGIPIVGPVVGRFLEQLARIIGARRIFEMGSAVGYSTIWWARAVGPEGQVYYSDSSPENALRANEYLERAGLRDRVQLLTGNSLDLLDQTDGEFDIVFNDVDKHYYPEAYGRAAHRVRVGGLLVTDNALWDARVADENVKDENTVGVREFNRLLYSDTRYLTTILPLRDGVSVGWRVPPSNSPLSKTSTLLP
jgi:caffeoyl-CoA O-methyltransferase